MRFFIFDESEKNSPVLKNFKRYTVTAALPYANGPVHIGHLAGCYLPADIYVRYLRTSGKDVKFICGSDEHGVPITLKARNEGISPQQVVDKYHEMMKNSFQEFGISFDIYSRTSSKVHHQTASDFFKNLYDKGVFTEEITEQYFDEKANQFLADRYIVGTCPKCSNSNAYGDQCEKCGTSLSPTELIEPRSTLSGDKPVLRKTKNWFLPLDKLQPEIEKYILFHDEWKPNVSGQCKSWLNQKLQPRAMTRDLDWGVKVPVEGAEGKVLYVWFDAPIGYISATKELLPDDWEKYWKDKDSKLVHFIGKDNIVFHCIIFPAMLMQHGEFILADNVPANEFLNLEGDKISTSRNWAVWLHEYLLDFPGRQDELRYVLTSIAPETKDSDFSWKDFQARVNNELVAILGNFVNRTLVLTQKYFDGKVPPVKELSAADEDCLNSISRCRQLIQENIESYKLREALSAFIDLARVGNKYLAENEPWKLFTSDQERVGTILNVSLQITAALASLSFPFLPETSKKISFMLNLDEKSWNETDWETLMQTGKNIGEVKILFPKIEDDIIQNQIEKLKRRTVAQTANDIKEEPVKAETTFEEFSKMDIRIATILEAEKVPKTEKLLKLLVDTGIEQRTVVSGIAEFYKPEEIIGQQVCLLANLAPRKIKGITSQGMILMAEDSAGKLVFASPSSKIDNGSVVR